MSCIQYRLLNRENDGSLWADARTGQRSVRPLECALSEPGQHFDEQLAAHRSRLHLNFGFVPMYSFATVCATAFGCMMPMMSSNNSRRYRNDLEIDRPPLATC